LQGLTACTQAADINFEQNQDSLMIEVFCDENTEIVYKNFSD